MSRKGHVQFQGECGGVILQSYPAKESNFFLLSDYWLIQNKKKYKKRDYYQILTLKGNCKDIEKKVKKFGSDKLVAMYTMALIKDNASLDFLPNYVTLKNWTQIDKA